MSTSKRQFVIGRAAVAILLLVVVVNGQKKSSSGKKAAVTAETENVLRGKAAQGDWTTDKPGVRRLITVEDLPPPFTTSSAENQPEVVARPEGAWPQVIDAITNNARKAGAR